MFELISFLGAAASVTSIGLFVPQFLKIWQLRNSPEKLLGVSRGRVFILWLQALLWMSYGIFLDQIWVSVPSMATIPLMGVSLLLLLRSDGGLKKHIPRIAITLIAVAAFLMLVTPLLSWAVFIIAFWSLIPQLFSLRKYRDNPTAIEGISLLSLWVVTLDYGLWTTYGILSSSWAIWIPSAVGIVLTLATIALTVSVRRGHSTIS